ncbi:MAG: DUF4124 domain-containing protein [Chromatiales bacterium]
MSHYLFPLLASMLGAGLVITATAAPVYKWVDENGKVHYGDRPGSSDSTEIKFKDNLPAQGPTTGEREEKTKKLLDQYADERAEQQEQEARRKEEQAQRKQNCAKAKETLDQYLHASYLYEEDKDGERRPLSKEERARAEAEAQKAVDHWCKPAG